MSWYSKNLGDAMLAWGALDRLEERFRSEYEKAGRPKDMALLLRHESLGDLHCELIAYLTPSSVSVAGMVEASPCSRPSPDGLSLVAGSVMSWPILFPEY